MIGAACWRAAGVGDEPDAGARRSVAEHDAIAAMPTFDSRPKKPASLRLRFVPALDDLERARSLRIEGDHALAARCVTLFPLPAKIGYSPQPQRKKASCC